VPLILKIYEAKFDALSKRCDAVAPIMSFPRYPQYKDSGVEWLGEVPGHWEVTALKRGFNVTLGKMLQPESNSPDDELLPYLRAANIQWDGIESTDIKQMWLSKRDRSQLRLEHGDLLVSEGGDVGRSCIWASELEYCYFQNSVNRVRARDGHSNRYLYYWISTVKDKGYIDVLCNKSTIAHFTAEKVAAVPVPLPTTDEQTQIAAFLDRETAKIDDLVAQQRRLMELLKEKRQAVISHAVTQGLNPKAPMKPSGIEWLGNVPAHWEVKRVRDVAKLNPSKSEIATLNRDTFVSFLPMSAIGEDGTLFLESEKPIGELESGYTYFRDGDVTIAKITPCYENGKGALMRGLTQGIGFGTTELIVVRPKHEEACAEFLHFLFVSSVFRNIGESHMYGAGGQKRVPDDFIRNFATGFPPASEQIAIKTFLQAELAKFDTLTAQAQRAIDLLQERRTALISAAVTGQIDVRKA
jgi:type I restriction enzyme, S subunit